MARLEAVNVWTDGCCLKNPGGAGGCAAVVIYPDGRREELSEGYQATTSNRMEIRAVLMALESLPSTVRAVRVYSDSKYVVRSIQKGWAVSWKRRGWKRYTGEPALNADLWARMLAFCDRIDVELRWVRGHSGNVENERCDRMACLAAADRALIDTGYTGIAK